MTSSSSIHMLCGYIGSGKTTFARKLERELPGFRLGTDETIIALFGHDPAAGMIDRYCGPLQDHQLTMATRLLQLGVSVIFERGFWGRASRDAFYKFAATQNVPLHKYYLTVPDAIMRARAIARPVSDSELYIAPATWDLLRPKFEPPTPDEGFTVIETG